jgi:hypothetical protein
MIATLKHRAVKRRKGTTRLEYDKESKTIVCVNTKTGKRKSTGFKMQDI